jgi:hypothetical protein
LLLPDDFVDRTRAHSVGKWCARRHAPLCRCAEERFRWID